MLEFLGVSQTVLLVIALSAFVTGALHGATGLAGGVTMTAILSHIVGIKVAIAMMTCALGLRWMPLESLGHLRALRIALTFW